MRVMFRCVTLTVLVGGIVLGRCAEGQKTAPCTLGVHAYSNPGILAIKNAPFSATIKTSMEQRLGDGNVVHGFMITHEARGSDGKTLSETPLTCVRGEDGQPQVELSVNVNDQTARTTTAWQVNPFRC